jgi:hypothetical protein
MGLTGVVDSVVYLACDSKRVPFLVAIGAIFTPTAGVVKREFLAG